MCVCVYLCMCVYVCVYVCVCEDVCGMCMYKRVCIICLCGTMLVNKEKEQVADVQ